MKRQRSAKAIGGITRRMTVAVRVTCHPHRRYRTFEAMLPVIEKKWRTITRSSYDLYYSLWDDMLQEAYILCWRNWEKGQLGKDDRYITAIVRTACSRVARKDTAMRGIGARHGWPSKVCEYAISDIVSQDDEDSYGDTWIERQGSPEAQNCPERGFEEKSRSLYSLNMERALNMALERLTPTYQEHCRKLAPYLAPDVSYSTLQGYSGLSIYQVTKALQKWREAAYAILAAH